MQKPFASLKNHIARLLSRRRRAPAENTGTAGEAALPPPTAPTAPKAPAADIPDTLPPRQPGRMAGLLRRIAFWRRTPPGSDDAPEAVAPDPTPAPPPREASGQAPRRPLGKRLLLVFLRKSVWLPAAGLLLAGLGAVASLAYTHTRHTEQDQVLRALREANRKLEQENHTLRARPAPPAVTVAAPTTEPRTAAATDPAFDITTKPQRSAPVGDDCLVTGKDKLGDALRRCIEAFNHAGGGRSDAPPRRKP